LRTFAIATTFAFVDYRSFPTVPIMSQIFPMVKRKMPDRSKSTPKKNKPTAADQADGAATELMETILNAAAMEETEDYLTRGRRFQHLTIESLEYGRTWAFKAWCQNRSPELQRTFDDSAAELRIRGAEPPFDTAIARSG
jgi:hypothetical protein